jgi:voltage-gated potassium channel
MEDVPVTEGSPLAGRTLAESDIPGRLGVLVAAMKSASGGMAFNPPPQTHVVAGDVLVVLGDTARVRALETALGIDASGSAPRP